MSPLLSILKKAPNIVGSYSDVYFTVTGKNGYKASAYINPYVTNNCQMVTLGSFANLLTDGVGLTQKEMVEILQDLRRECGRADLPLFMYDIKTQFVPNLKKYFDPVVCSRYTSSNGSDMTMGIISLKQLAKLAKPEVVEEVLAPFEKKRSKLALVDIFDEVDEVLEGEEF